MGSTQSDALGPDLANGIPIDDLPDGQMLAGHVGKDPVLLARRGDEIFAIGATCSHYGGPLAEGLMVDDTVRCPWHHACFSLRTGEALRAPALSPVACWTVERRDDMIFVRHKKEAPEPKRSSARDRRRIAREDRDRRRRRGRICGRRETASRAMAGKHRHAERRRCVSGRPAEFVQGLSRRQRARGLDPAAARQLLRRERHRAAAQGDGHRDRRARARRSRSPNGTRSPTTGCCSRPAPSRSVSAIPGADLPHVRTLRSLADCRAIIERAATARQVVVMGASFIGLEVAAALRARKIEVHVVAPEKRPMERILGAQMGDFVRALHEEHGVIFHLEDTAAAIEAATGHAEERQDARRGPGGRRRRGAAADAARREGRHRARPRRAGQRLSQDQCAGNLRGRRHRALARSAQRRQHPRRALGRRRAPGPDRGAQHAGTPRAVRRRSVLLEPALRRPDQLCGARREMGRTGDRGRHCGQGLPAALQARRHACSRSPRSTAISTAFAPSWRWSAAELKGGANGQGGPRDSIEPRGSAVPARAEQRSAPAGYPPRRCLAARFRQQPAGSRLSRRIPANA